jgi:flavine halogenase
LVPSKIVFDYLVDATGRSGLLSTKYFKNRAFTDSLKNIAIWGYWRNVNSYGEGTSRHGAPWFEALTGMLSNNCTGHHVSSRRSHSSDESGWAWFIPLHNGLTSVGVVMSKSKFDSHRKSNTPPIPLLPAKTAFQMSFTSVSRFIYSQLRPLMTHNTSRPDNTSTLPRDSNTINRYIDSLELAPGLKSLIGNGTLMSIKGEDENVAHMASDYSYSASKYAGNGWRIIGDAGGDIL